MRCSRTWWILCPVGRNILLPVFLPRNSNAPSFGVLPFSLGFRGFFWLRLGFWLWPFLVGHRVEQHGDYVFFLKKKENKKTC